MEDKQRKENIFSVESNADNILFCLTSLLYGPVFEFCTGHYPCSQVCPVGDGHSECQSLRPYMDISPPLSLLHKGK